MLEGAKITCTWLDLASEAMVPDDRIRRLGLAGGRLNDFKDIIDTATSRLNKNESART